MKLARMKISQLIGIAHAAKSKRFNSDDERKDFLQSRYEKTSLKDLTKSQLIEFINYCNGVIREVRMIEEYKNGLGPSTGQIKLINNLQKALNWSDEDLSDYIYKQIHKKTNANLMLITQKQAISIIVGMNRTYEYAHGVLYTQKDK